MLKIRDPRAIGRPRRPFNFLVVSLFWEYHFGPWPLCGPAPRRGRRGLRHHFVSGRVRRAMLITLMRSQTCIQLKLRDLRLHREMLSKIILVGTSPLISDGGHHLSNTFCPVLYHFGADRMSADGVRQIDQFMFLLMRPRPGHHHLCGQNLGTKVAGPEASAPHS